MSAPKIVKEHPDFKQEWVDGWSRFLDKVHKEVDWLKKAKVISKNLGEAVTHYKECCCDCCKSWWAVFGPLNGRFGPFSEEEMSTDYPSDASSIKAIKDKIALAKKQMISFGTTDMINGFDKASQHTYSCRCDDCKSWWKLTGLNHGPFSPEELA